MPLLDLSSSNAPCVGIGLKHTVVLGDNSTVLSFGSNRSGQLGTGAVSQLSPQPNYVRDSRSLTKDWSSAPLQVACGSLHTVLLLATGDILVWGSTDSGRLGLGDTEANDESAVVYVPQRVPSFGTSVFAKFVACGSDHTLVVDSLGDIWSWGLGSYGNLGHGTNRGESAPRIIDALKGKVVKMVAGGSKHSGCVTHKGAVFMWGHGDKGRLGNGAQHGTSTPELVTGLSANFISLLACGEAHSAAISDSGELFTWGAGTYGRLGHGEESDVLSPVRVEALSSQTIEHCSLGVLHSVAVTREGKLYSWGGGQYGKLGLNTLENVLVPRQLPSNDLEGKHVIQAFAGASHTAAVTKDGALFTWGDAVQGKLGRPSMRSCKIPERVSFANLVGQSGVIRVGPTELGDDMLVTAGGADDAAGVAGSALMRASDATIPRSITDTTSNSIKQLSAGSKHSMALAFNGQLYTWGGNEFGQLGLGTRTDTPVPTQVKFGHSSRRRVEHIAAGAYHSVCALAQGDVYAWGKGNESQISTGSTITETLPVLVQGLQGKNIAKVYAAESHSAALSDDGRLFTWGNSDMGKLGHGRFVGESGTGVENLTLPRMIGGPLAKQKVVHVSLGTSHSACIDATGKVYTWGAGWQGKLGLGSTNNQYTPQQVIALQFRSIYDVSCGAYHTMFITDDGDLYVCGRGDARLGLGETGDKMVPELNTFLRAESESILVSACASEDHSMVLTSRGAVWAWGKDLYGKLGMGATNTRSINDDFGSGNVHIESIPQLLDPSSISLGHAPSLRNQDGDNTKTQDGSSLDIRQIVSTSNHCLALAQNSTVFAWGSNGSGRLGQMPSAVHSLDAPKEVQHFFKRNNVVDLDKLKGGAEAASAVGAGEMAAATAGLAAGAFALPSVDSNGVNQQELEAHVRNFLETGKLPPLYVVQLFLKGEPKERQEENLAKKRGELASAERDLHAALLSLVAEEEQIQAHDYAIGLTITSTLRRLKLHSEKSDGITSSLGKEDGAMTKRELEKMSEMISKIPSFEKIFRLLLANPRYMINMYKIYVEQSAKPSVTNNSGNVEAVNDASLRVDLSKSVNWRQLFFELVGALYSLEHVHSEHLFLVFSRHVLRYEMDAFFDLRSSGANNEAASGGQQVGSDLQAASGSAGTSDIGAETRSLKNFLGPNMKCPSFLELGKMLFAQPVVTAWLNKHFESLVTDLFSGFQSKTKGGEELDLRCEPYKIYAHLRGNADQSLVSDAAVNDSMQEQVSNYPDVRKELEVRVRALRDFALDFFNLIVKVVSKLPSEVRLICKILHTELVRMFESDPDAKPVDFDKAVAKFLIDCLFRPAFSNPKKRKVLSRHFRASITKVQSRNMHEIITLLQNIFTGRLYPQRWLEPLNVVIRQQRSQVQAMVSSLVIVPDNLVDLLYLDIFTEYLRPREDPLTLRVSHRTLKFIRFCLHSKNVSSICANTDPLYVCAHEDGGILSKATDQIAARAFATDCSEVSAEDDAKVNLSIEMRFLTLRAESHGTNLDPSKTRSRASLPQNDDALGSAVDAVQPPKHASLRDGLIFDPISKVPVPAWMLGQAARESSELPSIEVDLAGGAEPADQALRQQLALIPDLNPNSRLPEHKQLTEALEKHLQSLLSEGNYATGQEAYNAKQRLNEVFLTQGTQGFEAMLRSFLSSLVRRRESAQAIETQLTAALLLGKRAEERLVQLKEQREALIVYLGDLRHVDDGDESYGRTLMDASASRSGSSGRFTKSAKRLHGEMAANGAYVGAYGKFSLKQLLHKKMVQSSRKTGETRPGESSDSLSPASFEKNKAKIKFQFSSPRTGVFDVSVVMSGNSIIDNFQIVMSKLAELERSATHFFYPSKVPFAFSVSKTKSFLEDLTMKHLLKN